MLENEQSTKKKFPIIPTAVGLIVVLVAAGGYFALRNVKQVSQASADAMPINTVMYASFDVVNLIDTSGIERVSNAFKPFLDEAEVEADSRDNLFEDIDADLEDLDMTVEEDIIPWVGRSIGMGLSDFTLDDNSEVEEVNLVIAIEIRDEEKADAFVTKFVTNYPDTENGSALTESSYEGVTFYMEESDELNKLVFGRSESIMLMATNEASLQAAIDAQNGGESLSSSERYNELVETLPSERAFTFYLDGSVIEETLLEMEDEISADLPEDFDLQQTLNDSGLKAMESVGMSGGLVDAGIGFDLVTIFDTEKLTPAQLDLQAANTNLDTATLDTLPANTRAYAVGAGLAATWANQRESLIKTIGEDEFNDAMQMAEDFVGFNPDTDLLPLLVGDFMFAVTSSEMGAIYDMGGVPLGGYLLQGIEDGPAITDILQKLNEAIEVEVGLPVDQLEKDNLTLYDISFEGAPIISYGTNNDYLFIGTAPDDLEALFVEGDKFTDSAAYKDAAAAFDDGMTLNFYVDIDNVLNDFKALDPEVQTAIDYMENIPTFAAATRSDEGKTRASMILFLDEVATEE